LKNLTDAAGRHADGERWNEERRLGRNESGWDEGGVVGSLDRREVSNNRFLGETFTDGLTDTIERVKDARVGRAKAVKGR
jgi:hypothetical protein